MDGIMGATVSYTIGRAAGNKVVFREGIIIEKCRLAGDTYYLLIEKNTRKLKLIAAADLIKVEEWPEPEYAGPK